MKTKVIEFINRIQDGGAETLIKDYALFLDRDKFDITVVCCFAKKGSSIYKTLMDNKIKVIQLYGQHQIICRAISRLDRKFNSRLLNKALDAIKPKVLHVHLEMLETVYYSREHLRNVKLLYTCHNLPKTLIGEDLPREEHAARFLVNHNNLQFIALHDEMAKEINERFDIENTNVIKNAIDLERFESVTKSKDEIRSQLGIPKDAYVLGSIGRLTYQKNPEFIVKVFLEALKRNDKAFLLMVGRGKQEEEIRKMIIDAHAEKNFLLLSQRNDIPEIIKAMDVFVFPSRYEGLGIVLIEAQASGIKCISSDQVPTEAYQSNLITRLSLDDSINTWVDSCLNPKCNVNKYGNLDDYNMKLEIRKLENIYLSK